MTGLPLDGHVHTEWSWDATHGDMEATCAEAVRLGVPGLAFTEHLDHTVTDVPAEITEALGPDHPVSVATDADGRLVPPPFDVEGYLASVERCRDLFPGLTILSGVEVGEPHLHGDLVAEVLAAGHFDRVLGSLHCLVDGDGFREPPGLFAHRDPAEVVRSYLAEVVRLVTGTDTCEVLAHVDYAVRSWPVEAGPFDPHAFEDELRHALRVTARSGRALEINTVVPLSPVVVGWWHEEGGSAVTFGSDAHAPAYVGRELRAAVEVAEACGFRPGRQVFEPWPRA